MVFTSLYNPSERPIESFMASYYDGEPGAIDTQNCNEAKWEIFDLNTMMALANRLGTASIWEIQ